MRPNAVFRGACEILNTADPLQKAQAARAFRRSFRAQDLSPEDKPAKTAAADPILPGPILPDAILPDAPARPVRPELVSPMDVPRRRLGTERGRGALLHAIAHIELNAIDLAADMIARFAQDPLIDVQDRQSFVDDWSSVCDDEARHFMMLEQRLKDFGMTYGDCAAHNGLWSAAMDTRGAFTARLAIAPLVLEARGLDVTPGMIEKLTQLGDLDSAEILDLIYTEEINHVRIGGKWFQYVALKLQESPVELFHSLVRAYFKGQIKPPFNVQARTLAGLAEEYYAPLVRE